MAPLKPQDIPTVGVGRGQGVRAKPAFARLPRLPEMNVAGATAELATTTRRAGQEQAQALRESGRERAGMTRAIGRNQAARIEAESVSAAAEAQAFQEALGNVAKTAELIGLKRRKSQDDAFANRFALEAAKSSSAIEVEALNSPKEGAAFVQDLDTALEQNHEEIRARVAEELGYDISSHGAEAVSAISYRIRTNTARAAVVASNNQRVSRIVDNAVATVTGIGRSVTGSADIDAALDKVDDVAATLTDVLPDDKLRAFEETASQAVYEAAIAGMLERADRMKEAGKLEAAKAQVFEAQAISDTLSGVIGEGGGEVQLDIIEAAKEQGTDPLVALAISRHESRFDPTAKNPSSSAGGLFQFTSATGQAYGLPADASTADVATQAKAGAKLLADNEKALTRILDAAPAPSELYLAHFLGLPQAVRVLQAPGATPLSDLVPAEVIAANPHLKGMTAGDVQVWAQEVMQANMEAIADGEILTGRTVGRNEAGVPINAALKINGVVATARREIARAEEAKVKEFQDLFSTAKPRKDRDPVKYLLAHNFRVQREFTRANALMSNEDVTFEQRQAAYERALGTALEEQEAIGLTRREAKVIPNDQADAIVNKLMEAPGPQAVQSFYATKALAGKHWDKLYGELVDQGLPASYQMLGMLDPARDAVQVNAVAQILNVEAKDLKADLGDAGSSIKQDLLDPIEDALAPFRQAFEFGPFNAGDQVTGMIEAAKKVGLNHYRKTGDLEAAREMATGIILKHVDVVDGTRIRALVPKEWGLGEDELEDAAMFKRSPEQIKAFNPEFIGAGPILGTGAVREREIAFRRQRMLDAATNYGTWVTNAEGDGLILVLPFRGSTATMPLRNAAGELYEIGFDEVRETANRWREATAPSVPTPIAARIGQ